MERRDGGVGCTVLRSTADELLFHFVLKGSSTVKRQQMLAKSAYRVVRMGAVIPCSLLFWPDGLSLLALAIRQEIPLCTCTCTLDVRVCVWVTKEASNLNLVGRAEETLVQGPTSTAEPCQTLGKTFEVVMFKGLKGWTRAAGLPRSEGICWFSLQRGAARSSWSAVIEVMARPWRACVFP